MNRYERLQQEAFDANVNTYDYYLGEETLKGVYIDGNVAINTSVNTSKEKACVLAEELGHHYTSVGDILDLTDVYNRKQERQARFWAYNKQIGIRGLIDAYEHGCHKRYEVAEYLEVTEEFLEDAIQCYRDKYGVYTSLDNYLVYFIPHLIICKKYE